MIESEYERYLPHLHDSGPREWREQSRRLYWLAVRAGVAGRRAERADAVAEIEREEDAYDRFGDRATSTALGRAAKWLRRGDHVGRAKGDK